MIGDRGASLEISIGELKTTRYLQCGTKLKSMSRRVIAKKSRNLACMISANSPSSWYTGIGRVDAEVRG